MSYVITQACCNDASCVTVCPVNCIHPTPDEPQFMSTEMLYIDPATCIDCAACVFECPVDAIVLDSDLEPKTEPFMEINAAYYAKHPIDPASAVPQPPKKKQQFDFSQLRVAVVGSGPAACYAAAELLAQRGVEVNMFERLLTPYGLVRSGVAPDHPGTKAVTEVFRAMGSSRKFHLHLGVEVGNHITHDELLRHHHAVIYAVGALSDRHMNVPGENLPGSFAATEFVAWYNGHPDYADREFDLSSERAVIIGNGNVAIDVARILASSVDDLAKTDIADHALNVLRDSTICEIVIVGRRGPAQAAYTNAEFLALRNIPGVDLIIDPAEAELDSDTRALIDSGVLEPSVRIKAKLAQEIAQTPATGAGKRIVFRYLASPVEVLGEENVRGIRLVHNVLVEGSSGELRPEPSDHYEVIDAGMVLRSIGYRGRPTKGVPFDDERGIIPNVEGRVLTQPAKDEPVSGVYVTGWIKRGPSGVIGTNKKCAAETVARLLDDYKNGQLQEPEADQNSLDSLVKERQPDVVDFKGWSKIDKAEVAAGIKQNRTRVKFVDTKNMLDVVRGFS